MTARDDEPYEETRLRHVAYAVERMPRWMEQLRWSRADIEAEQTRALRALLTHAAQRSRWHRERLRDLDVARVTPADLGAIPPMTKADLMAHWDEIVTDPRCTLSAAESHLAGLSRDAYFLGEHHVIASGGSSGQLGVFLYDWNGWAASYIGVVRSALAALALRQPRPKGPIASVSAEVAAHASSALTQTFTQPGLAVVRAPATLPLADIVAILNRAQPALLHTYPSMLSGLCAEAREGRLRISPAFVWTTSEPLLPEMRRAAETTWGVPVLNSWHASESNAGSFACTRAAGFHVSEDLNIIEPVDERGRSVPPSTLSAGILLTNLYNRVLPLVRYEISDRFEFSETPCGCGSAYRRVEDVPGRIEDIFHYAGGVVVHPIVFDSILGREACILEYRVQQTDAGADIEVVAAGNADLDALRSSLESDLSARGLTDASVTIRRVARIRAQTGKLKQFVAK